MHLILATQELLLYFFFKVVIVSYLFHCRIATNKIILLCIIVVELAILGAVVYIKFFKNKKQS